MDHRCGTRFTLSLPVELLLPDQPEVAARIVVVSVTGALVETRLNVPPLSPLFLRPLATGGPDSVIEAYVVRNTDRGIALEWLDAACDEVLALLPLPLAPAWPEGVIARPRAQPVQESP